MLAPGKDKKPYRRLSHAFAMDIGTFFKKREVQFWTGCLVVPYKNQASH